jgi:hypothetical protein
MKIPLHFGDWLNSLGERVEIQEREIAELKERLRQLEPLETPLTPAQFCERHQLKRGTVRDWLFHRTTNGLVKCGAVVTKGRRLYIYELTFLRWINNSKPSNRRLLSP